MSNENLTEVVYKSTTSPYDKRKELLQIDEEDASGSSAFLYISACVANLISFTGGAALSWSSPVLPKLMGFVGAESNPLPQPITKTNASWIAGIVSLGAVLGPLLVGPAMDVFGRKRTIQSCALIFLLSYVTLAYAHYLNLFYAARFVTGTALGGVFAIVPLYCGEISEVRNRGIVGCFLGIFLGMGILFSLAVGPLCSVKMFNLISCAPLVLLLLVSPCCLVDSPQFLVATGKYNEAEKVLQRLRGRKAVRAELDTFIQSVNKNSDDKAGIKEVFTSRLTRKAFIVSLTLLTFQQTSGINALWAYMEEIFKEANTGLSPYISSLLITIIQLVVMLGTSSVVDRLGRKLLLILSSIGTGIALFGLVVFFYMKKNEYDMSAVSLLPFGSLVLYVIVFNIGMGPLPWLVVSELFTDKARPVASTILAALSFIISFLITFSFPLLAGVIGKDGVFGIFGGCTLICAVYLYAALPETKGRSIDEILKLLD